MAHHLLHPWQTKWRAKGLFEQLKSPFAFRVLPGEVSLLDTQEMSRWFIRRAFGKVLGSVCLRCGSVIAYSFTDRLLDIAERAHAPACTTPDPYDSDRGPTSND